MATVKTSIQVRDGMTTGLRAMNKALNTVVSSFMSMEKASNSSIDMSSLKAAKSQIDKSSMAIDKVEDEIRQASEQQDKFNKNINKTNTGAGKLLKVVRNIGLAIGAGAAGKKFIDMSDSYSGVQARLNLINDGQQSVDELNQMIFESANKARGAYTDMADVIGKLGITASQAFDSNKEMLMFSELMTKSFKVAGASAQEQSAAMYQLTQAMASGRLQGDEFRSILENAPMLAQSIAKEMGVSLGVLKEMSSEGKITSDVIKNSLFNSAEEINTQFEQMPIRFDEIVTKMQNTLINRLQPAFKTLSEFLNSERGTQFINGLANGVNMLAEGITWVTNMAMSLAAVVQNNWPMIEGILYGIAGALTAVTVRTWAATLATTAKGFAEQVHAKGLLAAAKAQWGLNTALLASPMTWIAIAIGVVIALIVRWVKKVGGLKVAWLIMTDKVMGAWDQLKIGAAKLYDKVVTKIEDIELGIRRVAVGILNTISNLKIKGLIIVEDFINSMIGKINGLIEKLNKVPGVSIGMIGEVAFASSMAIEEEAKKQARKDALKAYEDEIAQKRINRDNVISNMQFDARLEASRRERKIDEAKKKAEEKDQQKKIEDYLSNIENNTGDSAEDSDEALDITKEELKLMRDLAEREVIDRTVLRDVKVDFKNSFGDIRETADVDGVMEKMSEKMLESLLADAEGV